MKIAITGGTGFVGSELTKLLQQQGHEIFILTRKKSYSAKGIHYIQWLTKNAKPEEHLQNIDAFVNLAGTSLNEGRWTAERKKDIYESRMVATKEVLRIIRVLDEKPKVLVNASAIGIYPSSKAATYTESSRQVAKDYLGKTVMHWEYEAKKAEKFGVRVAMARFGVILGKDAGALPLMGLPYKLFVGGTVGSGSQWVSWIHIKDVASALCFAVENDRFIGPFNVTAPNPVRMKQVGEIIAATLNRPHWFPAPSILLKLALGEKSQLVLEGQQVLPKVLLAEKFHFEYSTLNTALENLYA
ncbi:TIGR01777 family oxidoreductase [Viridibacillus sp. YIM B01967]|uniref:TIGR01777 family oxidoreductase n=1 Tax=Viridibacillus soli TaxID=2798301 RepID=A0ABS1H8R1_9BACL|nr:TIGR01777 family oxidoreductase [Viridibacillus soli]MBK3495804.1 TIGR01777 family oxidoreductase [Viridibacillus soli]